MSLSEGQCSITATEFLDRLKMIEEEWNEHSKLDYYLARICFEIYRLNFILGGEPKLEAEDFLLKFSNEKAKPKREMTEEDRRKTLDASKAKWFAFVGLGKDGKPSETVKKKPKPVPKPIPPRTRG